MNSQLSNNIDDNVDNIIYDCLNIENPRSFFLFAGAGSGKTRSLVNVLSKFKIEHGKQFRLNRQKVAIITYTNAAADEITHRLEFDPIFHVSTIHSFAWELIRNFNYDIKEWIRINLKLEITKLEEEQGKSRNLLNKTSVDRANKIESKKNRLLYLGNITKFIYNPNGDNISKDSLNHSEVISIAADFIKNKPLMQDLLVSKFPILFIDESQDTKKDLIDAFFELQQNKKNSFSLGLFGDTMQRIYSDGKETLGRDIPKDWDTPEKKMNHRSNKRIIKLINNIRKDVDNQEQIPRTEKEEGFVRLFICSRVQDKDIIENLVTQKMTEITKDTLWSESDSKAEIKILILEHHMAARRMGFLDFFEPLYKEDKLSTGLLDGSLSGANFFTKIILPLIEANNVNDKFAITKIVKENSNFLKRNEILKSDNQADNIKKAKDALTGLLALWNEDNDPFLIDILNYVYHSRLFNIPESLLPIAKRDDKEKVLTDENPEIEENEDADKIIQAWDQALSTPFSQIKNYYNYLSESSKFGTHQGVKGLEYPRVMVILDDEESRGFMFSYDKLFGTKDLSASDLTNIEEGRETGIDRTKRLFYVACSRAKESLAIVAYTNQLELLKRNVLDYGWFNEGEIEII